MGSFVLALILLVLAVTMLTLEKTYFYLPSKELKRQAARADQVARTLYRAAAYGGELKLVLWLAAGLSAAGGLVLFARVAPLGLGIVAVALALLLALVWLPRARLSVAAARIAIWCTPVVLWVMRVAHPATERLVPPLRRRRDAPHTGLYEREDLASLIDQQQQQEDNRISDHDLHLMRQALQFAGYKVHQVMTPRGHVAAVSADERISPLFLDELHKAQHPFFPVYEEKKSNIVGMLELETVADISKQGKVCDYYDRRVAYVHEHDDLEQALQALYETGQHLLLVVDNAGAYVGIVALSDILRRLFGTLGKTEAAQHEDRHAVATRHRPKTEAISEKQQEVVE